ncbi:hypothetical protein KCU61_g629, partial [Aureobasidium melanogenum]
LSLRPRLWCQMCNCQKREHSQTSTPAHYTIFENVKPNMLAQHAQRPLKNAQKFTCTGMTHKGPLFLGGTPLQRRTDTRNSTEYWPCAASDMIQPRAKMVKFSCSTLRGEYLCHTFGSLIRL